MKKHSFAADEQFFLRYIPQIALLAASFLIGGILGSLFAANLSQVSVNRLSAYAGGFSEANFGTVFSRVFWGNCALLAVIFIAAFFRGGTLIILMTFIIKGFNLSRLITAFIKVYGTAGYLVAILAEALYAFGVVACLIFLAVRAFSISASLGRRTPVGSFDTVIGRNDSFLVSAAISMLSIVILSLLYAAIAPMLAGAALSFVTK